LKDNEDEDDFIKQNNYCNLKNLLKGLEHNEEK
jgi:hypothetical protein